MKTRISINRSKIHYFAKGKGTLAMRAEIENSVKEIDQALSLIRRHL